MYDERSIVSDGTNAYVAKHEGLNKIVAGTGAQSTLVNNKRFVSLTYGNSTLYGADKDGIYSINTTTGALTPIVDMPGITHVMYHSTTNLLVLKGNSLVNVVIATGAYTYIRQDM